MWREAADSERQIYFDEYDQGLMKLKYFNKVALLNLVAGIFRGTFLLSAIDLGYFWAHLPVHLLGMYGIFRIYID